LTLIASSPECRRFYEYRHYWLRFDWNQARPQLRVRPSGGRDGYPAGGSGALAGRLPDCAAVAGTAAELLARPEIDAVVIAVTHDMLGTADAGRPWMPASMYWWKSLGGVRSEEI
jgi:hypothetical protein